MNASSKAGRGLRIGITVGLREENEGLWTNGIKQNVLSLAAVFQNSPRGHAVCIVNTTAVSIDAGLAWDRQQFPTCQLDDVVDSLDLLIALGGALTAATIQRVQSHGGKVVGYKCGVEYIMSMQAAIFDRAIGGTPTYPADYDAIWAIPQVVPSSAAYWQVLHRVPVTVVPFVWDPRWLEAMAQTLPGEGLRQARKGPRRVTISEPNHDVVKFCLYPLMIAELAWRQRPDLIEFVSVTNTARLRHNAEFIGVVQHLDLVRQHKAFFEDRFPTAWFLAHHTDVVVSHQWENPLNYAYLETAWLGYPLVHNAPLIPDIGHPYDGFDVEHGARQLIEALQDDDPEACRTRQRAAVQRYLSNDVRNVEAYDRLLDGLLIGNDAGP